MHNRYGACDVAKSLRSVDCLEILVLVDNVVDILSTTPGRTLRELANLQSAGWNGVLSGQCMCIAQWGLSFLVTAVSEGVRRSILFDTGSEEATLFRNAYRLGVDFSKIDSVVLSHGHWDHVGALSEVAKSISDARSDGKAKVHANQGQFLQRGRANPDGSITPHEDVTTIDELQQVGADIVLSDEPRLLSDGVFYLSGEIDRSTSYETGMSNSHVRQGPDGVWEADPFVLDERYIAVDVGGDKGVVVLTACGHAGIINTLQDAEAQFGAGRMHGLVGGFHLAGEVGESRIESTVSDLARFKLKHIIPGHCTGWRATSEMVSKFGEDIVTPSAVGMKHTIKRDGRLNENEDQHASN